MFRLSHNFAILLTCSREVRLSAPIPLEPEFTTMENYIARLRKQDVEGDVAPCR